MVSATLAAGAGATWMKWSQIQESTIQLNSAMHRSRYERGYNL